MRKKRSKSTNLSKPKKKVSKYTDKFIADPVHGTIGLSQVEADLIETKAFQRLRNIKHLGLASYVYPGADFSRFAHSIGTCHIAGRVFAKLEDTHPESITDKIIQEYRLAALLHDIGHYPFSHAIEQVVEKFYSHKKSDQILESSNGLPKQQSNKNFNHEEVGYLIIKEDEEISRILNDNGYEPASICNILERNDPSVPVFPVISSDFDVDRIDYLKRTAHHTDLPYGAIDDNYLISQVTLDDDGKFCLHEKAVRAIDHFLLSRYFAYYQVSYHRDVIAHEEILRDIIQNMLTDGYFDLSAEWVENAIKSGEWYDFDDPFVLMKIREYRGKIDDEVLQNKIDLLLRGKPPVLIAQRSSITERDNKDFESVCKNYAIHVQDNVMAIIKDTELPESSFIIWNPPGMLLTKIGRYISADTDIEELASKKEDLIRILENTEKKSKTLLELESSMFSLLSQKKITTFRIYLIPSGENFLIDKNKVTGQLKKMSDKFGDLSVY